MFSPALALLLLTAAQPQPALAATNPSGVWFGDLPPVESVEESKRGWNERARRVLDLLAEQKQVPFDGKNGIGFWLFGLAKLATGKDVAAINLAILDPSAKVYARVGSDFQDAGFLCRRTGDYDFMLRGIVELYYHFGDRLWPEARKKLLHELLNQRGNKVHLQNFFWACGIHNETENHVLMTEGSRYLTNQAVEDELLENGDYDKLYDNELNGMNEWMLRHLREFLVRDFSEYNSRPYQAYTVMAIQNIYEFAEDARVKLAAEMLLNFLDARYAASSNGLRRQVPFRRQPPYRHRTDMWGIDDESERFFMLAGPNRHFRELPIPNFLQFAFDRMEGPALGKYRTPDPILDLVIDKSRGKYFQRFHHKALEAYASSPSFLVSAGGIFIDVFAFFTKEMHGWAVPTTLMPTVAGIDASQFIRIEGHKDDSKKANMCLAPGFACGLNPVLPDHIPEVCIERSGDNWAFVDFTSRSCPLKYGFYVAFYSAPCDTGKCAKGGGRFGFFEAAEPAPEGFAAFRDRVLKNNGARQFFSQGENDYVASDGRVIRFTPLTDDPWTYPIVSIDGVPQERDMRRWPLAGGDLLQADGSGLVTVTNPFLRKKLTLDLRDALNPRRSEENY